MIFILVLYGGAMLPWPKKNIAVGPKEKQPEASSVSIVIPFRNEGNNLDSLLLSLSRIIYPKDKLEIILIDDHSLDNSQVIVKKWQKNFPFTLALLQLEAARGKKAAISLGIDSANGELLLCTDADCVVQPNWVSSFDRLYRIHDAVLITGMVSLRGSSSILSSFQKLDQAILMRLTEHYIHANRSILANAANMAIKKAVFEEQFLMDSKSMSGDDIFLLHALKKKFNGKIHFNSDPESKVYTKVKQGLFPFLSQRLRWASKSKYYRDIDSLLFGGIIFFVNIGLLFLLFACIFQWVSFQLFLLYFSLKSTIDLLVLYYARKYIEDKKSLYWLPVYALSYPFYSIGIALLSLLYNPKWKGRTV